VDLERALEAARQLGDPVHIGWALGVLAAARWSVEGDWQQAETYVDELLRMERLLRGTRASGFIAHALGLRFVVEGDVSALERLRDFAAEEQAVVDVQIWQTAEEFLARLDLLQGRPHEARARLEAVFRHPAIESQHRGNVGRELVRAHAACGEPERAEALIAQWIEEAPQREAYWWPEWLLALGEVRAAQGRWEEARESFKQALSLARERNYDLVGALIALSFGEALANHGERGEAVELLQDALIVFRRLGGRPFIERAEQALAALA
jgi:tetratricopeptide (TPR) repeat protein